jgi:hypothetical protein
LAENAGDYEPSVQEEVLSDSELSRTYLPWNLCHLLLTANKKMKYLGFNYTRNLREVSL